MRKMSERIRTSIIQNQISRGSNVERILEDLWQYSIELEKEEKEVIVEARGPGMRDGLRAYDYYFVKFGDLNK